MLRAAFADTQLLIKTAQRLPSFERPALLVWASGDRVMPLEHGRRLAAFLPQGRLIEVTTATRSSPWTNPEGSLSSSGSSPHARAGT